MNTRPDVIVSDVHHRISGVSTTCRAVTPLLAHKYNVLLYSRNALNGVDSVSNYWSLVRCLKQHTPARGFYIWHARRNNEMQLALFAKHVLRVPIKIVFTSAAIRRHSWWPRQLIAAMDHVIATSSDAARFVKANTIVPHGVDMFCFEPKRRKDDQIHIGISGRVRPEKGTDLLVAAVLPILQSNPSVRLLIAGAITKKYRAFATALRAQLISVASQVEWLGELAIDEMPKFYQNLDIICAPARYEGFGVVPLEAMACATAVVASKTGAYPDIVASDVGVLVDVGDVVQLRHALNALIEDRTKLADMQRRAVEHVKKFDLANEAAGIAKAYESVWSELI